jgi:hypothetical protein
VSHHLPGTRHAQKNKSRVKEFFQKKSFSFFEKIAEKNFLSVFLKKIFSAVFDTAFIFLYTRECGGVEDPETVKILRENFCSFLPQPSSWGRLS